MVAVPVEESADVAVGETLLLEGSSNLGCCSVNFSLSDLASSLDRRFNGAASRTVAPPIAQAAATFESTATPTATAGEHALFSRKLNDFWLLSCCLAVLVSPDFEIFLRFEERKGVRRFSTIPAAGLDVRDSAGAFESGGRDFMLGVPNMIGFILDYFVRRGRVSPFTGIKRLGAEGGRQERTGARIE